MKTKLLFLAGLFTTFCFGQVSNFNLVAYYNFENSGANQLDSSMFNLGPLSANGANPTYTNDGILGNCANFSGFNCLENSSELSNYLAAQSDKSLTISFWMKSNDIEDGLKTFVEGFESVVVRGRVPSFFISRTEGFYESGAASNDNNDNGPFFADTNVWNHIVYVYNAAANSLKGYINNILMVDLPLTGSETEIHRYNSRFVVGAGVNGNAINWVQKAYTGKIDEMYVFARAITEDEVEGLFNFETLSVPAFKNETAVNAYPNPFTDRITVSLNNFNDTAEIFLYDFAGKKLMHESYSNQDNLQLENLKNLSSGVYFLKVQSEAGFSETVKLFKK